MADSVSPRSEYSNCAQMVHHNEFPVMLLEPRPFRPFKTSEEYLYAMKEDLAEWLNTLYGLDINVENFMKQLETGVVLCRHANHVLKRAREYEANGRESLNIAIPSKDVVFKVNVSPGTFQARDNISNFITWCRLLQIHECLLFETDDLVMRKNEKSFILCLLEVARRGSKIGILAPTLIQFEEEIDRELAEGTEEDNDSDTEDSLRQQIITNDLKSLHERVVELLSRCTCPTQYNLEYISDGKYRIGESKVLIFVRILRSHVMVRVGGGWDTLEHYLDKHDPCRCRSGHRYSYSARLSMTPSKGSADCPQMQVTYNRPIEATTSASFPKRTQLNNSREMPSMSSTPTNGKTDGIAMVSVNGKHIANNRQKQSPVNGISNPGFVQNDSSLNSNTTKDCSDSSIEKNYSIDRKILQLPHSYSSNDGSNKGPPKLLPKPIIIDSSSSEQSENESKAIELNTNNSNPKINCGKRCSPRNGIKVNEYLSHKSTDRFNRRYSESDESSVASDELSVHSTRIPRYLARNSSKGLNRNNRTAIDSNNYYSKPIINNKLVKNNKSQSSDDIRQQTESNKLMKNLKITQNSNNLKPNNSIEYQRRLSADNSQLGLTNGIGRYGRFTRSQSQSSQLGNNTSNTNKPKQLIKNTEKVIKPSKMDNKSEIPTNGRQVKTWSFKQRNRPPIDSNIYDNSYNTSAYNNRESNSMRNLRNNRINKHLMKSKSDLSLNSEPRILTKASKLNSFEKNEIFRQNEVLVNE